MLYILPGMGANSEMYIAYPEWRSLKDSKYLDWPDCGGALSLSDLASKMIDLHGIKEEDIIVGSSLGGMVALEIAKLVKAKKVILIGSAINPSEVNHFLLSLTRLVKVTPIKFIQLLTGKSNSHLISMFRDTNENFIRAMCLAIKDWQGAEDFEAIERIHGFKDLVISCPSEARVIADGGHLIAMTHAKECTDYIKELVSALSFLLLAFCFI